MHIFGDVIYDDIIECDQWIFAVVYNNVKEMKIGAVHNSEKVPCGTISVIVDMLGGCIAKCCGCCDCWSQPSFLGYWFRLHTLWPSLCCKSCSISVEKF